MQIVTTVSEIFGVQTQSLVCSFVISTPLSLIFTDCSCAEKHEQILPYERNRSPLPCFCTPSHELVLSVDRSIYRWSDYDLKMMALWGNARANAYRTGLYGNTDESRYWGAKIPRTIDPDMSKKARERLIYEKYVLKSWVSTEPGWETEMQKNFPLNMDELSVLEYLNKKPGEITRPPSIRLATPAKRPTSRPDKRPEKRVPDKRPISRDSRWSDEVICDGRSVRLAVIEDDQFPRLHRSEKIINDGRQRQRTSHRTKHKVDNSVPEDDVTKNTQSTKEETVREVRENVGNNPSQYIDPVPNSRDIIRDLGQRSTEERLVSKALSETVVNQTRRRWRMAKDPGESSWVGKSGIAVRQKSSRARCRRAELDEEKGLKIDRLFESNVSTWPLEPRSPAAKESHAGSNTKTEAMDIDRLLESPGVIETPVLQPLLLTTLSVVPDTEVEERPNCSEDLVNFSTGNLLDDSLETLLERCSIDPSEGNTTGIWKIMQSL